MGFVTAGVLSVLRLAYAFLAVGNVLLGLAPVVVFTVGYLGWRLLALLATAVDALRRIADALERIARESEGE